MNTPDPQQPADVSSIPDAELIRRALASFRPVRSHGGIQLWSKAMTLFGLGSSYARQLCVRHGFDPYLKVRK